VTEKELSIYEDIINERIVTDNSGEQLAYLRFGEIHKAVYFKIFRWNYIFDLIIVLLVASGFFVTGFFALKIGDERTSSMLSRLQIWLQVISGIIILIAIVSIFVHLTIRSDLSFPGYETLKLRYWYFEALSQPFSVSIFFQFAVTCAGILVFAMMKALKESWEVV